MATEYYIIDSERLASIASAAHMTVERAREYLLADWAEGSEHQEWLDTASIQEIADWLVVTANQRNRD